MMVSTHVLDAVRGVPAAGMGVTLYRLENDMRIEVASGETDQGGRIVAPFGGTLEPGLYELLFAAGAYLARFSITSFYEDIPIRFRTDSVRTSYHVPLLLSPYGYSTYRGS